MEYKKDLYIYMESQSTRRIQAHNLIVNRAVDAGINGYLGYIGEFLYSNNIEEGFIPVAEKKKVYNEFVAFDNFDLYENYEEDDDGKIIKTYIKPWVVVNGRRGSYEDREYTIKLLVRKISDDKQTKEEEDYIKNLKFTEEDIDKIMSMQEELFKEDKEEK